MKLSLLALDRRIIYFLVLLSLSYPLLQRYSVPPAELAAANRLYDVVEKIDLKSSPGVAFVGVDWGPNTSAENGPQTEVVVEHLMRRRIPIVFMSLYQLADPFLVAIPERISRRLTEEMPGQVWEYGKDWVNLGYRPGVSLIMQSMAKSNDIRELFGKDVYGTALRDVPMLADIRTIRDIKFVMEVTGLVGVFDNYVQFFQSEGYRPSLGHGCTSITVPEAYIYLDSGQIVGLLEGIAGAAWYSELLRKQHSARAPDDAQLINTGLGIAQLVVLLLIVLGNVSFLVTRWRQAS